jgi:hypothetical protein
MLSHFAFKADLGSMQGSCHVDRRLIGVVKTVFPNAISLLEFCTAVADSPPELVREGDDVRYLRLLHSTLVVPPSSNLDLLRKVSVCSSLTFPITDMVGRLVSQCVRSNPAYYEQNCLALGYRAKSAGGDATMRANNETELHFVNTVQAMVTTQVWQIFANRVGKAPGSDDLNQQDLSY